MSSPIVAEQFLETNKTVGLEVTRVSLVLPVLELLSTVSTDETLRVELVSHGSDDPSMDQGVTHEALVLRRRVIHKLHFFKHCSSEHVAHILLVEIVEIFKQSGTQITNSGSHFNIPISHGIETIHQDEVIQLLAGDCLRHRHGAVVHHWLCLGWWRWWAGF